MTLKVILAEDDFLVRQGVERILGTQDDIEVVASCGDYRSALKAVERHRPDVVVSDIRMPPTMTDEGIRLASELGELYPDTGVVVLSQYDDPEYVLALLDGGSAGRSYLLKEKMSDVVELTRAIRAVASGGSIIDPQVVERLVEARSRRTSPMEWLTARETEVLEAMAQGMNNSSIAAELGVGVRSVEKHINSIFAKLGLTGETSVHKRVLAVVTFLSEVG